MVKTAVKKKILIDLDVITVAEWDSEGKNVELARKFITRVESKEFYVGTPSLLIDSVLKWKHETLKERIKEFYEKNSNGVLEDKELKEKCIEKNVDYEHVLNKLEIVGIKREDAALVPIASLFAFDCLVTFNRTHLKNKKEEANKILRECKLSTIQIAGPEEI